MFSVHLPWFTTNNKNKNRNDQNWTAAVAAAAAAQRQMCVCSCPRITVDGFIKFFAIICVQFLLSSKNIEKSSFFCFRVMLTGRSRSLVFVLLTRNLLRTHVCVCVCLRLYVFVRLLLWSCTVIVDAACTLFRLRMIWLYKNAENGMEKTQNKTWKYWLRCDGVVACCNTKWSRQNFIVIQVTAVNNDDDDDENADHTQFAEATDATDFLHSTTVYTLRNQLLWDAKSHTLIVLLFTEKIK